MLVRYSQVVGIILSVIVIVTCFFPWIEVSSKGIMVSGFSSEGTNFGKPGILHVFFSSLSLLLFLVNRIWAKRLNIFVTTAQLAWAIRNYILLTSCYMAECPKKFISLYILVAASSLVFLMSLMVPNSKPRISNKS